VTPEFNVSLNIAQLVLLGGLIWNLARMSKAVDNLGTVTDNLTRGLEGIGKQLTGIVDRVSFLEGAGGRRATDKAR
jgi:uncharacterized protein YoxC